MNPDLVMAEKNGRIYLTHPAQAKRDGATVLEGEPTTRPDGSPMPERRASGRPAKPRTSVAKEAAKKKAAQSVESTEEASA